VKWGVVDAAQLEQSGKCKDADLFALMAGLGLGLLQGCDSGSTPEQQQNANRAAQQMPASSVQASPTFEATPLRATYHVARCQKKACAEIEIYTLHSASPWFDQWLLAHLAKVIQQQHTLEATPTNTSLSLQQAVNRYAKQSAAWQQDFVQNQPYDLQIKSSIAVQQHPYVLLQVAVDSEQAKQHVALADVIAPAQQAAFSQWLQQQYRRWLKDQSKAVQMTAPKQLQWKSVDWFFDQEGIGLHYRANEIVADSVSLDIYLSKAQTQTWLKPQVYAQMFTAPSRLKTDTKLD
jgi:hypothetical protein